MATYAEYRQLDNACSEYNSLKELLPATDRRLAIATVRLIISETYAYGRKDCDCKGAMEAAKTHLAYLQTNFPTEKWLIARAKTSIALMMQRCKVEPEAAEQLYREVVQDGTVTERMPVACSLLSTLLYSQGRYAESASFIKMVADNHPYSTWADFAMVSYAENLMQLGQKDEAGAVLDQVMSLYPDSRWATVAKTKKEYELK
jgi:outer membrane protein assembly factor BamD (BamD/ComL family)